MAKIIISLPDELLAKVQAFCDENDYNRSELIRFALRNLIKKADKKENKDVE
jgi:metal-responsive CopG/Arc/MetJ family transcriptional regulator